MKNFLLILILISFSSIFADVIYLKNGTKIDGEIISIAADSVTIQTKGPESKLVKVATNEIARAEREKGEVTIAKSVKMVGFGCLGGVMGAAVGITAVALGNGFDNEGRVSITVISALVIIGILIGVNSGAK
jgi:hypothetical protein